MTEKICTRCERKLPLSSYHRKGDGYQARCKSCRSVKVVSEADIYTGDPLGNSFFRDVVADKLQYAGGPPAPDSRQRLERHRVESQPEARDITSSGGAAGLIPPVFLADLYAELPRPPRPVADRVGKFVLPPYGDDMTIPVLSGGTTVAVGNENSAVSETDITSNQTISAPVVTISGYQDASLQLLRSANFDEVIYYDLMKAANAKLDSELLNGSGSGLNHLGIRNVTGVITQTFTSGTPTPELFLTNLAKLCGQVSSQRFASELLVLLHPRRAAWAAQASGTSSLNDNPAFAAYGFAVEFAVDANIVTNLGASTNQDQAYVLVPGDLLLGEEPHRVRASNPLSDKLNVRLELYNFSAFISWRAPKGVGILDGSGMSNPGGYS